MQWQNPAKGLFARSDYPLLFILISFAILNLCIFFVAEGNFLLKGLLTAVAITLFVWAIFLALQGWLLFGSYTAEPFCECSALYAFPAAFIISMLTFFRFTRRDGAVAGMLTVLVVALIAIYLAGRARRLSQGQMIMASAALATVAGFAGRAYEIFTTPFAQQSDMLYLIMKSIDAFLSGASPYQQYLMDQIPGSPYFLYLTYLPGEWLAYIPTRLLGIDLRWTNAVADLIVFILIVTLIRRNLDGGRIVYAWLCLSLTSLFFLNGYFIFRIDTEMPVFCLVIALLFMSFFLTRYLVAFAVMGVLLATSPLAWLMLPFVVVFVAINKGVKKATLGLLITLPVAAAMILPFLLWSYDGFVAGVIDNWTSLNHETYEWAQAIKNINLSVIFFKYQAQGYLKYFQAGIAALVLSLFVLRRNRRLFELFAFMSIVMFLFLNLNIVVWTYLYEPVMLMTTLAIVARYLGREHPREEVLVSGINHERQG